MQRRDKWVAICKKSKCGESSLMTPYTPIIPNVCVGGVENESMRTLGATRELFYDLGVAKAFLHTVSTHYRLLNE